MPKKDSELEPVNDLKMVQRYLRYGVELRELVCCALEESDVRFEALIQSADGDRLALELEITEESFAKLDAISLNEIDQPQVPVRLSYSVNEATFFVHAKLQGRTTRRIVVKADMPMFKLQRRDALRIKVVESHKATIKLGAKTLPLFDISAGGLSVVVPAAEENAYRGRRAYPDCALTFLDKQFKVTLEVKNVLAHGKDGKTVKVGFRFVALPASVEQVIVREAYLHTHKIWSRWI